MPPVQQGGVSITNDHPSSARTNGMHAITAPPVERPPELADMPTARDAGVPGGMSAWRGLSAPAATPPRTAVRFEAACERPVRAAAAIRRHERIQTPIARLDARAFGAAVARGAYAMRRAIGENNPRQVE